MDLLLHSHKERLFLKLSFKKKIKKLYPTTFLHIFPVVQSGSQQSKVANISFPWATSLSSCWDV